jgi:hypothetical protein
MRRNGSQGRFCFRNDFLQPSDLVLQEVSPEYNGAPNHLSKALAVQHNFLFPHTVLIFTKNPRLHINAGLANNESEN